MSGKFCENLSERRKQTFFGLLMTKRINRLLPHVTVVVHVDTCVLQPFFGPCFLKLPLWNRIQVGMYEEGIGDDYIFGLDGVNVPLEVVLAQQMAAQTIQTTYRQEFLKYGDLNSSCSSC